MTRSTDRELLDYQAATEVFQNEYVQKLLKQRKESCVTRIADWPDFVERDEIELIKLSITLNVIETFEAELLQAISRGKTLLKEKDDS